MKYEVTYKKASEHFITIEAQSFENAIEEFRKLLIGVLEGNEAGDDSDNRRITGICEDPD